MTNMLRLLIFLFLGVCAYLTSNEKSNYSRHPKARCVVSTLLKSVKPVLYWTVPEQAARPAMSGSKAVILFRS